MDTAPVGDRASVEAAVEFPGGDVDCLLGQPFPVGDESGKRWRKGTLDDREDRRRLCHHAPVLASDYEGTNVVNLEWAEIRGAFDGHQDPHSAPTGVADRFDLPPKSPRVFSEYPVHDERRCRAVFRELVERPLP